MHLIVPKESFKLVSGDESLATYTFNTGVAKHYFCKVCGCKPYYVPRSNPDGFSVNVRCLDHATIASLKILPFDGKDWEGSGASLARLSASS
ncbi:MAG: GFA family protein [Burkholderiaceae bacterium]|nr:GFA family protein [Burkholderiaceae bacterium]